MECVVEGKTCRVVAPVLAGSDPAALPTLAPTSVGGDFL